MYIMTRWTDFVKDYAKRHNMLYGCAISYAGDEYQAKYGTSKRKRKPSTKLPPPNKMKPKEVEYMPLEVATPEMEVKEKGITISSRAKQIIDLYKKLVEADYKWKYISDNVAPAQQTEYPVMDSIEKMMGFLRSASHRFLYPVWYEMSELDTYYEEYYDEEQTFELPKGLASGRTTAEKVKSIFEYSQEDEAKLRKQYAPIRDNFLKQYYDNLPAEKLPTDWKVGDEVYKEGSIGNSEVVKITPKFVIIDNFDDKEPVKIPKDPNNYQWRWYKDRERRNMLKEIEMGK